jgi:hypothetical protein
MITFAGSNLEEVDAPFVNQGAILQTGTGWVYQGNFTNNGTYDLRVDRADAALAGGSFVNAVGGVFTGGTNSSLVGLPFTNAGGTVTVTGTGLRFSQTYTQTAGVTNLDRATWTVPMVDLQGGRLVGGGTIVGNVRNAGEVSVGGDMAAGQLTIMGNYTQTAAGTLTLEIGGYNPGVGYDLLAVTGSAALDGTLNVSLINGFIPTSGDTFQPLTFNTRNGVFATANVDSSLMPPVYDSMDVTLVAF